MAPSLEQEIGQQRPFQSPEHEATLNLLRTASLVAGQLDQVLKPFGLTTASYNVLRILKGSDPAPLSCGEIRSRLVTRMPDVTRLIDRMEKSGLLTRARQLDDRRQVHIALTDAGHRLLAQIDPLIEAEHRRCFCALDRDEMRNLVDLLTEVRNSQ
ncbi:MAG TPA: MarR family transcriptional regulator [Gemmatimonadales bacterium]|nr:MarR family transcriptional regulator [Gemmatimonadales bacterium]